jgi:DnaJ-class molecular chaperone
MLTIDMADPYQVLGVTHDAKPNEIRSAFRSLAKKHHPDLHPGDKTAEARFKEIASAYAIVGDDAKRALFDAGKIDGTGADIHQPPPRESYRQHAEAGPGFKYDRPWGEGVGGAGSGGIDDDLFAELFGRRARANMRGADISYTFAVPFIEAITGAKKRVVMADGKALDISIPPGLKDGQTLRLRGQGEPGLNGGEPGDVLVEVHIEPHPLFRREGNDLFSTLPVTLGEALAGAKVPVETVSGTVNLTVPKGSNTGARLRLRGKGAPYKGGVGDHFVELKVVLPTQPDDAFVQAIVDWELQHPYDPRIQQGAQS